MGRDISERVLQGRLAAERPDISAASCDIVSAIEEDRDGVAVALTPAKTTGGRNGQVSEAAVAILMDKKRSVTVPWSC
jgi:hypothetical protein